MRKLQRSVPKQRSEHVWRKLKQLGAIALQDAVWVLPQTPRTQEQFQWLAIEIERCTREVGRGQRGAVPIGLSGHDRNRSRSIAPQVNVTERIYYHDSYATQRLLQDQ